VAIATNEKDRTAEDKSEDDGPAAARQFVIEPQAGAVQLRRQFGPVFAGHDGR
jgi:hypothetical protein